MAAQKELGNFAVVTPLVEIIIFSLNPINQFKEVHVKVDLPV